MAGLLGTVTGIMQSLAGGRIDQADQERMMRGIGFALAATAAGLLLAMGAFSGRALFGRRTEEMVQSAARRVS
jgi:biopolymer transport protein ExbB/TolQ